MAGMEAVILCGGRGLRIQHEIPRIPKPLVEVGGQPIVWHVMNMFRHVGVRRFVLCLGYKGSLIEEMVHRCVAGEPELRSGTDVGMQSQQIICRPTGLETNTGERIKRVADAVRHDVFFATYSDGLADLDLYRLLQFHRQHGRIATITSVQPTSPFGIVRLGRNGRVHAFQEKPRLHQWINGGFFVFDRRLFDYMRDGDVLESDTFGRLVADGQLMAYRHRGFWMCMDTYKDHVVLNRLWNEGQRPWARWLKAEEGSS